MVTNPVSRQRNSRDCPPEVFGVEGGGGHRCSATTTHGGVAEVLALPVLPFSGWYRHYFCLVVASRVLAPFLSGSLLPCCSTTCVLISFTISGALVAAGMVATDCAQQNYVQDGSRLCIEQRLQTNLH